MVNSSEKQLPVSLTSNHQRHSSQLIDEMSRIKEYASTIAAILEEFRLIEVNGYQTVNQLLTDACQRLLKEETINDVDRVLKAILERECLGELVFLKQPWPYTMPARHISYSQVL